MILWSLGCPFTDKPHRNATWVFFNKIIITNYMDWFVKIKFLSNMMYKNLTQQRLGVQYIFTAQNIPDQLFHTISHHVHLESVKEGQAQLWRPEERSSGVCSVLRAVLYSRMCAQLTLTPWGRPRHLASVLLYSEIESVPLRESRTSPVLHMQISFTPTAQFLSPK